MTNELYDSDEVNNALRIIRSIKEEQTPAYKADQKKRKSWHPVITRTNQPAQPSLSEQEKPEYQRYEADALLKIRDICETCHDMSDCWIAGEMRTLDEKGGCWIVRRNMK
jgi:hypothetical protein